MEKLIKLLKNNTVNIILIVGPSNSGKTHLSNTLQNRFSAVTVIHFDDFLNPKSNKKYIHSIQFDEGLDPRLWSTRYFDQVVRLALNKMPYIYPLYSPHQRKRIGFKLILPKRTIVIDGPLSAQTRIKKNKYTVIAGVECNAHSMIIRKLLRSFYHYNRSDLTAALEQILFRTIASWNLNSQIYKPDLIISNPFRPEIEINPKWYFDGSVNDNQSYHEYNSRNTNQISNAHEAVYIGENTFKYVYQGKTLINIDISLSQRTSLIEIYNK